MSEYYWDSQLEYLRNTRWLYYNDDYLEFLVKSVWKIHQPVKIIDYGCGYGFLGLKLLPMLPEGSTYTGFDKSKQLTDKAIALFSKLSYQTEFLVGDIEEWSPSPEYDMAMCHAFLLHMTDPKKVLQKMIDSVVDQGRIVCFEPHWIGNMANYGFEAARLSKMISLGPLQKLYEEDFLRSGKDGNIGIKIPIYLSQLGLKNVECRVSDKVNFLDPNGELDHKERLYASLKEDGLANVPGEQDEVIQRLINRGLTAQEAQDQYTAEMLLSREFGPESFLTYVPNMKISFGVVNRE